MNETIKRARDDTNEWLDVQEKAQQYDQTKPVRTQSRRNWKKPHKGWIKCNYDASHHERNRASGLGWIIRNFNGVFLNRAMGKYQGRQSIEEAECSALLWALQSS